jgi:hypothetical protein
MDLFAPVVAEERLHHNFLSTLAPTAAGVRAVLTGWAQGFEDRDGKFVREFQTSYNSAFWEIYLFAVLKLLGIELNFSFDAPDFVCARHPMAIEAAVASHAEGDPIEVERTIAVLQDKDLAVRRRASIIRLSNALMGKSQAFKERYAALPHMAGRSYVIAISNFGTQDRTHRTIVINRLFSCAYPNGEFGAGWRCPRRLEPVARLRGTSPSLRVTRPYLTTAG